MTHSFALGWIRKNYFPGARPWHTIFLPLGLVPIVGRNGKREKKALISLQRKYPPSYFPWSIIHPTYQSPLEASLCCKPSISLTLPFPQSRQFLFKLAFPPPRTWARDDVNSFGIWPFLRDHPHISRVPLVSNCPERKQSTSSSASSVYHPTRTCFPLAPSPSPRSRCCSILSHSLQNRCPSFHRL